MSSTPSESHYRVSIKRLILECLLLVILGFCCEVLFRLIGPTKRGFYCNDLSIGYIKTNNVMPTTALISYVLLGPFLVMLAVESYRLFFHDSKNHATTHEQSRSRVEKLANRVLSFYVLFLLAFIITWILTTITKFSVGRLRPHFLATCKPDVEIYTLACFQKPFYIEKVNCTNEDNNDVDEARLSFFSGHSSYAMVTATYIVFYLHARLASIMKNRILTPLLQMIVLSSGLAIAFSRIVDHSHHAGDVAVGILLGSFIAILTAKYVAKLFDPPSPNFPTSSNSVRTDMMFQNV